MSWLLNNPAGSKSLVYEYPAEKHVLEELTEYAVLHRDDGTTIGAQATWYGSYFMDNNSGKRLNTVFKFTLMDKQTKKNPEA